MINHPSTLLSSYVWDPSCSSKKGIRRREIQPAGATSSEVQNGIWSGNDYKSIYKHYCNHDYFPSTLLSNYVWDPPCSSKKGIRRSEIQLAGSTTSEMQNGIWSGNDVGLRLEIEQSSNNYLHLNKVLFITLSDSQFESFLEQLWLRRTGEQSNKTTENLNSNKAK